MKSIPSMQEIVRRAQSGDPVAFSALAEKYRESLETLVHLKMSPDYGAHEEVPTSAHRKGPIGSQHRALELLFPGSCLMGRLPSRAAVAAG